jgi:2-(1,2-epoxy-1,2-dihydrophenyl)acetyl-CoA isomerase
MIAYLPGAGARKAIDEGLAMSDVLHATESCGVLTLRLNRPERLNAIDGELIEALIEALREAQERDAVRCVVLQGTGRAFSTGQDLAAYVRLRESGEKTSVREYLAAGYNVVTARLRSLEKPVIASVRGMAAGAGLSLALACDVRIAAEDAQFTLGFSKIGLIPDGGASLMLPLIVGLGRAFELAYASDRIDAHEALRIGLVNRVVPSADLESAVAAFAAMLLERPARGLALTKRAFNRALLPSLAAWLEEEADLQEQASQSEDHREGILAFVEKRTPVFTGR